MLRQVGRYAAFCAMTLGLLVLLAGCAAEGGQAILDLLPLQAYLRSEFGASNIAIELEDGKNLSVAMVDETSGRLVGNQRADQSQGTGDHQSKIRPS